MRLHFVPRPRSGCFYPSKESHLWAQSRSVDE
jgi:hypothetical protein